MNSRQGLKNIGYDRAKAQDAVISLNNLKTRLFAVGLYETAHLVNKALERAGYELAENIEALETGHD